MGTGQVGAVLKGICQNLSLSRLYHSSSELAEKLRNIREYSQELDAMVAQVKEDYDATVAAIAKLKES